MLLFTLSTCLILAILLLVPLSIKWELDQTMALPAVLGIGLATGLILNGILSRWSLPLWLVPIAGSALVLFMATTALCWRFFRDPERTCPEQERTIVAAADGRVIYVKHIQKGQIPVSEKQGRTFPMDDFTNTQLFPQSGYLVGTAMTYLDVHVNRAPIEGQVECLTHITGSFFSLKHPESAFQNERVVTIIKNPDIMIGIIQIASRLVRNIIPFTHLGSYVLQGQRIGKIRFGSQVDIFIPDHEGLSILTTPGETLKAGCSIIAHY